MPLNYLQKRKRCGKARCRTCQEAGGHGPYWYASQTIGGRTVEKYVGKHLPAETQQAIGRAGQSPFVGRQEELAHVLRLLDHIEALRHPRSATRWKTPSNAQTLILTGEVGIGKTRLAEEIAREAALRTWPIIWISVAQENTAPYQMWSEMLRATLAQGLWKRLGVLRQPERYQPLHILLPDVLDRWPEEMRSSEQLHLWEAMRMLLGTICEKAMVLVVFDNVQWADSKSCELLAYLARHLRGTRMLFLCTCRENQLTNGLHPLLTDLQYEHAVEVLPMTPLGDEQIQELISHVPATLAERIVKHIQGNPLFAEELARSSLAGDLTNVARPTRPRELPETIAAVLALRLAHISPPCQRLLECGAVLGDVFPFTAISAIGSEILQVDEDQFLDLLEEAMQAGTLIEEGSGDTISYHFWHPLLRTHLYNDLSAARRASLHRKAAYILQSLPDSRKTEYAAQIVHHLVQSGAPPDQIAYHTELAAHHTYSLSAYKEAAHFYGQLLGYVRSMPKIADQQEREAQVLEFLAECARIQGDAGLARSYYEQALYLHEEFSQTVETQALLWAEIGLCWLNEGDLTQAKRCYTCGEERLHVAGLEHSFAWAKLRYEQSYLALCEGKHQNARSLALEALALFSKGCEEKNAHLSMPRLHRTLAGDPVDMGRVHALIGIIAIVGGQAEEALAELLKAYTLYERYHQTREIAIVCCNLGDLYMRRGAYEHASEVLEQALDLAHKMDYAALISFATGNLGVVALRQGDLSTASTHLTQALNGAEQNNDKASMSFWSSYTAQAALAQGQIEKARGHIVQALVYARQCCFEPYIAIGLVTAASFHLASLSQALLTNEKAGVLNKAKKVLHRAFSLSGMEAETHVEAQIVAAHIATLEGDQEASRTQAQIALEEAQQCGIEWAFPLAKKWLS